MSLWQLYLWWKRSKFSRGSQGGENVSVAKDEKSASCYANTLLHVYTSQEHIIHQHIPLVRHKQTSSTVSVYQFQFKYSEIFTRVKFAYNNIYSHNAQKVLKYTTGGLLNLQARPHCFQQYSIPPLTKTQYFHRTKYSRA